ncbi:MAG TPA: STAS domain-containing protein [Rhodocyclaceae bacterium]|nr:STAS domain-containing protein [Rhodocyclaceae bacterium]
MIQIEDRTARVLGPMSFDEAGRLFGDGIAAIRTGISHFDLHAVTQADSAGLAVLLAWCRTAAAAGTTLRFEHVPVSLLSLADLYDVKAFLPLAQH